MQAAAVQNEGAGRVLVRALGSRLTGWREGL